MRQLYRLRSENLYMPFRVRSRLREFSETLQKVRGIVTSISPHFAQKQKQNIVDCVSEMRTCTKRRRRQPRRPRLRHRLQREPLSRSSRQAMAVRNTTLADDAVLRGHDAPSCTTITTTTMNYTWSPNTTMTMPYSRVIADQQTVNKIKVRLPVLVRSPTFDNPGLTTKPSVANACKID